MIGGGGGGGGRNLSSHSAFLDKLCKNLFLCHTSFIRLATWNILTDVNIIQISVFLHFFRPPTCTKQVSSSAPWQHDYVFSSSNHFQGHGGSLFDEPRVVPWIEWKQLPSTVDANNASDQWTFVHIILNSLLDKHRHIKPVLLRVSCVRCRHLAVLVDAATTNILNIYSFGIYGLNHENNLSVLFICYVSSWYGGNRFRKWHTAFWSFDRLVIRGYLSSLTATYTSYC